jgi:putative toxin-antitoxin system antitoxin component (TIGR02293 family)
MAAHGLSATAALDLEALAAAVGHGLPSRVLGDLQGWLGLSQAALARVLGIPPRTLHRRMRGSGRLPVSESERVARFGRLYHLAARTLGSRDRARAWLGSKPKAFGGRTPLEMAATEPGARVVEQVLGRIEHGAFT